MHLYETAVSFSDERGVIVDLIENENINAVTLITIKRGAVRGNHYHEKTWQWNYVLHGRMKLVTQMPGAERIEKILEAGQLALTDPYERHALVGVEDCEVLVFTKGPRGGKEYESDTFRLEIPLVAAAGEVQ
jgi:oxalate decarboxylase/phosphoglucose isomerase-like protein (cupin superfamily)